MSKQKITQFGWTIAEPYVQSQPVKLSNWWSKDSHSYITCTFKLCSNCSKGSMNQPPSLHPSPQYTAQSAQREGSGFRDAIEQFDCTLFRNRLQQVVGPRSV